MSKIRKSPLLIVLLVLMLLVGVINMLKLSLISPGWEIYDQIGALRHNDIIYSDASQFTSPKELMGVYWKVDVDDPYYGVPTIMIEVGDIHHVDFTGQDIPNDQYAKTITVTRGTETYYLDYHIYLYTITIRTIADKSTGPPWLHETSWPHEWDNGIIHGGDRIGEKFAGGVYTKFVISPWKGGTYRTAPENYVLYNCWAGVMNTYVLKKEMGQIANQWGETPDPDSVAPMFVKGGLDDGNQVPMLEDDGTFGTPAPTVNWDPSLSPDVRIESTVVHYLPIEMLPGCKLSRNIMGSVIDIAPADVFVMYNLRVDVLQIHGFTLETAYKPPTPKPPTDFYSWVKSFWESVGDWLSNPWTLFLLGILGSFILLVLLLLFAPGVVTIIATALFGRRRKGKG